MLVGKQRRIGGHHHLVGVALDMHQVDGLGKCVAPLVLLAVTVVLYAVFAEIYLALLVLVEVAVVLA